MDDRRRTRCRRPSLVDGRIAKRLLWPQLHILQCRNAEAVTLLLAPDQALPSRHHLALKLGRKFGLTARAVLSQDLLASQAYRDALQMCDRAAAWH